MAGRRQVPAVVLPARNLDHHVTDVSRAGQVVRLKGERATYKVHSEVLNVENGSEWVVLFGGPSGHGCWRHVSPDRVKWPIPRKTEVQK